MAKNDPEGKAMVLALRARQAEIEHGRVCDECRDSDYGVCPRGQELNAYALEAHETVMEFILGEPTAADLARAEQALRDAFKKADDAAISAPSGAPGTGGAG